MIINCLLLLNILFVNSNNSNNLNNLNTPTSHNSFKSYDSRIKYNLKGENKTTYIHEFKLNKSLFNDYVYSYYLKK